MRGTLAALIAGIALLLGTAGADPAAWTEARTAAWTAGDCDRCHEVPDREPLDRTESCVGCHRWIVKVSKHPEAREAAIGIFPKWERYEKNTRSYLAMPDFAAAMARLDPAWVAEYLKDPHDLRPGLAEGMPRFDLSEEQRRTIAGVFGEYTASVPKTSKPTKRSAKRGEALFAERGCTSCHAFGAAHPKAILPLAPDLQHARDRMTPDMIAAWIRDPRALSPTSQMPGLSLPEEEVLALRDYVLLADFGAALPPEPPPAPTPLSRPVTWDEVESRVFGRICVHCHMDPEKNEGRAGPGNAGGFGFEATGIELQTVEGIRAVADRIGPSLLRRRHEARRDAVPVGFSPAEVDRDQRPGMPLGLPPLPDEDIALVLAWIEQGMPGPLTP